MAKQHTPHDRLFRETLSHRSEAIRFFKHFLPEDVSRHLDLETLELQNTSFVNERLENHFSDMVYSCKWVSGKREVILTFLLEHKSYPEKYPHLQLMRYLLEGYEYQLKQKKELSLIVPVLLYHGKKDWEARPFKEYFDLPDPFLQRFVPSFDFIMVNLHRYADEQILAIGMCFLASSLLLFKHKLDKEYVLQNYRKIFIFVEDDENREETEKYLRTLILYVFQSFDIEHEEIDEIANDLPKKYSDMFTSTYEKAVAAGEIKGVEKGKQIGLEKGKQIGMEKGKQIGLEKGKQIGIEKGKQIGIEKGKQIGIEKGKQIGIEKGKQIGQWMTRLDMLLQLMCETPVLSDEAIAKVGKVELGFIQQLRICLNDRNEQKAKQLLHQIISDLPEATEDDRAKLFEIFQSYLKEN